APRWPPSTLSLWPRWWIWSSRAARSWKACWLRRSIPSPRLGFTRMLSLARTPCSAHGRQLRHHRHQVASQLLGKEEGSIGAPVLYGFPAFACSRKTLL
ncbi:unnamed protein product, partial [Symbiodinium necroappetens]